jgi:SanA protein
MKRKLAILAAVGVVLVVAAILVSGALIRSSANGRLYSAVESIPHRHAGLLLGCASTLSDGRTNLFFTYRIEAAAALFKAGKIDCLIVSGDNHVAGYDEPSDMKQALMNLGIPSDQIYCDYAGFRTLDSVVRARAIFGQTNITVISQGFHNQRAIYIARHEGVDAIGFSARDVDSFNSFRTRVREQLARVKTVLDVCLLGTGPKFLGPHIEIDTEGRAPASP